MDTTKSRPEVSVILPTFNRVQLVERAIRSVLSQTTQSIELIIVDDGSTDGSAELIHGLSNGDTRMRYVHQTNQGLASARNTGVAYASGRYVTFIDSDDEYESLHLELRKKLLDTNGDVVMLHGGIAVINGSPMVPDYYRPGQMIDVRTCAVGATFFYRRELHDLIGGFKHRDYGEDTEFFERVIQAGPVRRVHWPTYRYYRDSDDSIVAQTISRLQNPST